MKIAKIPISLRKDEIYSIAEKYKSNKYYQIKHLLHNNIILENDDSSIDCILNGDSIKIIEFLEDCDLYYYDSLIKNHKNSPMMFNILFSYHEKELKKIVLNFPIDTTVMEMKKSFLCKMEIPFKFIDCFIFYFECKKIPDNALLKNIFKNLSNNMSVTETRLVS